MFDFDFYVYCEYRDYKHLTRNNGITSSHKNNKIIVTTKITIFIVYICAMHYLSALHKSIHLILTIDIICHLLKNLPFKV